MKALIMGGGMSGLATAVNLIDLGLEVELVEADEIFGGRASSWLDEDGDQIENALHVFLSYYINLMDFFKKLGVYDRLSWTKPELLMCQDDGDHAFMRYADLPAPLHMLAASLNVMKNYRGVPKWHILFSGISLAAILGKSPEEMDELDGLSWAEWVYRRGPKGAFDFLNGGLRGLTFTEPYALSAKVFGNWMRKVAAGYEYTRYAYANGGLGEIWVGNCLEYIRSGGGKCETNKTVTDIKIENDRIVEVTLNGTEKRTADIYISAMQAYPLRTLLPASSYALPYFQDLCYFHNAPSLSIQIWLDKQVTDRKEIHTAAPCTWNCMTDLSLVSPQIFKGGSMLECVIAPADDIQLMPDDIIFEKSLADIRRILPEARSATVKKYKIVRERQGVYRAFPGMEKHRPNQRSPYGNFYLTGDWTRTPVSSGGMEAAVWTANRCTEIIAQDKLNKTITLNKEFKIEGGFISFLRYIKPMAMAALAVACAKVFKKMM